jgi:hypothetical protein
MNIAIEYLLRQDRAEKMLTLPASLLLTNIHDEHKMIVVLRQAQNGIHVLHFKPNQKVLTPEADFLVSQEEVFTSPHVVIAGYKLLEFNEATFDHETKQVAELPMAAVQEKQYTEFLGRFFSPKGINKSRENWLWIAFEQQFIPKALLNKLYYEKLDIRRSYLLKEHKDVNKVWDYWKKQLLPTSDPAAELIFKNKYDKLPKGKSEEDRLNEYRALFDKFGNLGIISHPILQPKKTRKKKKKAD